MTRERVSQNMFIAPGGATSFLLVLPLLHKFDLRSVSCLDTLKVRDLVCDFKTYYESLTV